MGLAAPVIGAGDGEVKAPVGGGELTREAAEAEGFVAAVAAAISAAARRMEEEVGGLESSSALSSTSSMASSEADFSAIS